MAKPSFQHVVDVLQLLLTLAIPVTIGVVAWLRRPSLSIEIDDDRVQSRVEGKGTSKSRWPYVRLLVRTAGWRRVATGSRVLVDGYRVRGSGRDEMITLGTPSLSWTSALGSGLDGISIFSGVTRPFDLGELFPAMRKSEPPYRLVREQGDDGKEIEDQPIRIPVSDGGEWQFRLAVNPAEHAIADDRHFLWPGDWTVTLTVGADEGTAKTFDVELSWNPTAIEEQAALNSLLDTLSISRIRRRRR